VGVAKLAPVYERGFKTFPFLLIHLGFLVKHVCQTLTVLAKAEKYLRALIFD
jgi:hypothetical protein